MQVITVDTTQRWGSNDSYSFIRVKDSILFLDLLQKYHSSSGFYLGSCPEIVSHAVVSSSQEWDTHYLSPFFPPVAVSRA